MTDLTSGLAPEDDYPILDPARDLTHGENHAFWFFDHAGRYALLNCHIQGGGSVAAGKVVTGAYRAFDSWATRRISFPLAGLDGAMFVDFAIEDGARPDGYALAGWDYRCVRPFERWEGRYRGTPLVTTRDALAAGNVDLAGPRTPVEVDVDFEMGAPAWIQGPFVDPDSAKEWGMLATGCPRYEQLARVTGAVRIPGQEEYRFTGTGIRTHRYGARAVTAIDRTSWLSALFPSGRAFGSMHYREGPDARTYSDAFVAREPGRFEAVRILDTPFLERADCVGRRFTLVFASTAGEERVEGEILATAFNYGMGIDMSAGALNFCHAMTRFRWNGEETVGMTELGLKVELMQR